MRTKVNPNVFDKVIAFAPSQSIFSLFIAKGKHKKDRYVLMWKKWRIEGQNPEEIISKLMIFKRFGYHTL